MSNSCEAQAEIELVIGASETWVVYVKRNKVLFDLTGCKGYFGAKLRYTDPDYVIRKRTANAGGSATEMLISDQVARKGQAEIYAVPADSKKLAAGKVLPFDCWFVTPAGLYLPVIRAEVGRLTIKPTVTRF